VLLGEQLPLLAPGQTVVAIVRVDHDLDEREHVPGCRQLLEVLRERAAETLPPGTVTADRESVCAPLQGGGLGHHHVEPRPLDVLREAGQELLPAAELRAGHHAVRLDGEIRQFLAYRLGSPAIEAMHARASSETGGRLSAAGPMRAARPVCGHQPEPRMMWSGWKKPVDVRRGATATDGIAVMVIIS
jgi:hypothetical protein